MCHSGNYNGIGTSRGDREQMECAHDYAGDVCWECDNEQAIATVMHAVAVLRESAKQHRTAGDGRGHGTVCDRAAEMLNALLTDEDRAVGESYWQRQIEAAAS